MYYMCLYQYIFVWTEQSGANQEFFVMQFMWVSFGHVSVLDHIVDWIKANLHGMTLMHATSLRQAYDMTWDHLHVYNIFTNKIKYAKVCTTVNGAKKF